MTKDTRDVNKLKAKRDIPMCLLIKHVPALKEIIKRTSATGRNNEWIIKYFFDQSTIKL